jgi:hypothetical protein
MREQVYRHFNLSPDLPLSQLVIPAKAGIQKAWLDLVDSGFRRNDGRKRAGHDNCTGRQSFIADQDLL